MSTARPRQRLTGFTLLEVMMVVLLIGILSGIAMLGLNFGGPERQLDSEAGRLSALLEQVANEAVMQNREFGLKLDENSYRFLCLHEEKQRWQECEQDAGLGRHTLPEGLKLSVLQAKHLSLDTTASAAIDEKNAAASTEPERAKLEPDVLLLSSGESSPASLRMTVAERPEQFRDIRLDAIGRVQLQDEKGGEEEGPPASGTDSDEAHDDAR